MLVAAPKEIKKQTKLNWNAEKKLKMLSSERLEPNLIVNDKWLMVLIFIITKLISYILYC